MGAGVFFRNNAELIKIHCQPVRVSVTSVFVLFVSELWQLFGLVTWYAMQFCLFSAAKRAFRAVGIKCDIEVCRFLKKMFNYKKTKQWQN